jgi:hypothetical protein
MAAAQTGSIAAGGSTAVTLDLRPFSKVSVVIKNTGANAISSTTVEKAPKGNEYGSDTAATAAIGSIAAGGKALLEITDVSFSHLKLTLANAAGGTSYSVEYSGKR